MENIRLATLGETPTRKCVDCGFHSTDLTRFTKSNQSKYGRRNLCISCSVKRTNAHPGTKDWKTDHQTKKRYGIDVETYKQRMQSSDKSEICSSTKELCYDHDHKTMEFRGVLCRACNRSLGQLGDNLEGIKKVVDYLERKHIDE